MVYLASEESGPSVDKLVEGWTQFAEEMRVNGGFDWFITLTFNDDVTPDKAKKELSRWVDRINRNSHGKRWRNGGTGVTGICALAFPDVKYGTHIHGLLGGTEPHLRRRYEEEWKQRNGWARIRVYDDDKGRGAIRYICRHLNFGAEMLALSPTESLIH